MAAVDCGAAADVAAGGADGVRSAAGGNGHGADCGAVAVVDGGGGTVAVAAADDDDGVAVAVDGPQPR